MKVPDPRLWAPLVGARFFTEVERRLGAGERGLGLSGLVEGSRALVLLLLAQRLGRSLLLVVPDDNALEGYQRDLTTLSRLIGADAGRILALPALDNDPYDDIAPHPEVVRDRVVALERLLRRQVGILLVPARALLHWLPAPEEWVAWSQVVRRGDTLPPDRFVLQAMGLGYRRVDTVSAPGEVSRRGGIVDVFPPTAAEPVRIELFGDTVESLRTFDTHHQRSTGLLEEVGVGPAMESPPTDQALLKLSRYLESAQARAGESDELLRSFRARLDQLREEGYWPGFESLAALTAARPVLLFEYAPELILVVDEHERTVQELVRAADELGRLYAQSENHTLPAPDRLLADPQQIRQQLEHAALFLQELAGEEPACARVVQRVVSRTAKSYAGRLQELAEDLTQASDAGRLTVFLMRAEGSAERLGEVLGGFGLGISSAMVLGTGAMRTGFELPELGLTVLTEREVFGEDRKPVERKGSSRSAFIADFHDLKRGALVVHVDHGIARYSGLGRPKGGSLNRDFMVLEFAGGDRLFVPVDRLDLVQRYSGVAGKKPMLDRLGGPGWERLKSRVRQSVQSMAQELLELYARRMSVTGHRFAEDTPWQRELEAAFPYELTPDQARALAEVKRDMESARVMDRLLVGDVGFGKTEIAVRAAFKAVMDGQQVALLTPTTVLALQHFETFAGRFAPFPVRVEMVSRFRTAAENRSVLAEAALGTIDVIIGTHRLLSKDVQFKRLGLLLLDEEQRFGVAHKERLKSLAVGVDSLAMTATPIPRTLQMSLAGVRDLSVIETPPPGRMAIRTYLLPWRDAVLAQAIRQELRREGQVFVVDNRIEQLPGLVRSLAELVPDARIVVAHGQMAEGQLESVMVRFVRYEADILVTTAIIENGLDIPRANTIIVNRAERFGLAQLYQLRGRVGRSQHHAYAYFVTPPREQLTEEARRRLRALQEFSELGAGFRLAAADLEIRGAGELLGSRQHGHIAALGFDLYCQLLERSVRELQGQVVEERRAPSLHLGVDIKIPESYLPEAGDRLALYKRLAEAQETEDVDRLQAETEDRFGHLPQPARNLFDMGRLRLIAERVGVQSVDVSADRLHIRFQERPPIDAEAIIALVAREHGSLTPSGMLLLPAPARASDRIEAVRGVLQKMLPAVE